MRLKREIYYALTKVETWRNMTRSITCTHEYTPKHTCALSYYMMFGPKLARPC